MTADTVENPHESHDWARALDTLHAEAWQRLARGVADRRAAARHPTLATVDASGMPQARTVVLRAADRATATLRVYTDRLANKVKELQAHPHAALHVWDKSAHLQIRLLAEAVIHTGESVHATWEGLSEHARQCYGFSPASGDRLEDGLDYQKWPALEAFAVLQLSIQQMEVLHLGHRHRRARYRRCDDWAGHWLVP